MRAGFVEVTQARSDWAPDPEHPLPRFDPPRRVPHGITLIGRLFDEGTLGGVGLALERAFGVVAEHPPRFSYRWTLRNCLSSQNDIWVMLSQVRCISDFQQEPVHRSE